MLKRLMTGVAVAALAIMPVLAQTTPPASTPPASTTKPPVAAPASPPAAAQTTRPAAAPMTTAATPAAKKVNLNTATAAEIDALPEIGKARSKAIMDERAKSQFKDWADFDKRMTGTSVNAGAKAKIKDLVTF